ncbi:hypothetical protein [Metabacillus litoralis]|uniref:hypothetical protein n=1 Tax=Metabacillus litoralis TaxID=152268 RepID=UPI00203D01C3|nr:hypothetical protein [Metabacillus litoralis]MCM3164501.1 hypothetical protein [Metabacillus litoralis]
MNTFTGKEVEIEIYGKMIVYYSIERMVIVLKKFSTTLLLVLLLLTTACQSQKNVIYTAEGDNWIAKIDVMQTTDKEIQSLILQHQGEDLENIDGSKIKYHIETDTGSSSGTGVLTNGGVLEVEVGNCSGCAFVQEDDEFILTVEGDEKIESLTLKIDK